MAKHGTMIFQLLGGEYHMLIESAEDLRRIGELDDAHWFATSAPANSLSCDGAFLSFVDADGDGRIRIDEVKAAQRWLFDMLSDRSRVGRQTDKLALDHIDLEKPGGVAIHRAAELILSNLGRQDAREITLADVRSRKEIMGNAHANGDGVIPAEAARDEKVAAFIRDVGGAAGTETDASGLAGITAEILDSFLDEAKTHIEWLDRGEITERGASPVMVWGADTPAAWEALAAVRDKIDEYFALCAMASFDPRVIGRTKLTDEELKCLDVSNRLVLAERLRKAPLDVPHAQSVLALGDRLNPAYREEMSLFARRVIAGVSGQAPSTLTKGEWEKIKEELAPYGEWLADKKETPVESLGAQKLREYVDGPCAEKVRELIAEDEEVADELARIADVERLILYQRWLLELANNLVSFPRFYDPEHRSMVEAGTLVMDGRRLGLSLRVSGRADHMKIARRSHMFIVYLEVSRDAGAERFEIASAVTAGTVGDIWVGKRGVFITLDGRRWGAVVLDVITNPVGVGEALRMPFKRLSEFLGKFLEKFSGARYKDVEKKLSSGLSKVEKAATAAPATGAAPGRAGALGGLLIGGGVAFAALGSALAYMASKMKEIGGWNALRIVGWLIVVVMVAVALPTVVVAVMKLRRRNMSALLEAGGWAVNRKMRLTASLGRLFTRTPSLPDDAEKRRLDLARKFLAKLRNRNME